MTMYFPQKFNRKLAIELGNLIISAYQQYQAFERPGEWQLPDRYTLIREFKYSLSSINPLDIENKLIEFLHKFPLPKREKPPDIPIGFIARSKDQLFIIFRGTRTPTEWINNLNADLTPFSINKCGNVHEGFFNLYMDIRDEVLDAVTSLPDRPKVYIAGHSLGATFASFAAYDIEITTGHRIHSLYTFGSPRLGDNEFVRSFNNRLSERSFRVANSSDIVTEVPFPTEFAGFLGEYFSHVETPIVFTIQDNDIEKNHDMGTYMSALSDTKDNPVKALFRNLLHRL
jgi:triacylglycerol lipase